MFGKIFNFIYSEAIEWRCGITTSFNNLFNGKQIGSGFGSLENALGATCGTFIATTILLKTSYDQVQKEGVCSALPELTSSICLLGITLGCAYNSAVIFSQNIEE